ncbi:MAG: hypothetical protein HQM03_06320 [Magnetococcales bacterium]|nr:hypothetical protein [Magnetococcales bacterium]
MIAAIQYWGTPHVDPVRVRSLALSMMTLSGTMMGFLMTTLSIMNSISETVIMKRLLQTTHLATQVFSGIVLSIIMFLMVLISAKSFIFVPDPLAPSIISYLVGMFVMALYIFVNSGLRIYHILRYAKKPDISDTV